MIPSTSTELDHLQEDYEIFCVRSSIVSRSVRDLIEATDSDYYSKARSLRKGLISLEAIMFDMLHWVQEFLPPEDEEE